MSRLSQLLAPTLREDPADAEVVSHRLLLRAGMMRQVARGIYDLLPLGLRAVRRFERIVREEMDRAGADWQLIMYGGAQHGFTHKHAAPAAASAFLAEACPVAGGQPGQPGQEV